MSASETKITKIKRLWVWCRKNPKDSLLIGCATIVIFYASFLGDNSLLRNLHNRLMIHELQSEIAIYNERKRHDEQRLNELDSTATAIYQFARERYYMKSASEDVYIFAEADSLKKHLEE
ncbi:MAG: septum formation initiator family protein [Bacteroidales bacterium]|nr:septum formation initiator family protein [Bacteroidales bacterium]